MKSRVLLFASLTALSANAHSIEWFGNSFDGAACTGGAQGFGPYDFFEVDEPSDPKYQEGRWWEVSVLHAQPGMAAMQSEPFNQIAYNRAASEFDYILRAFPTHPDILYARILLELKRMSNRDLRPYPTPPECYLQRGAAFLPNQPHVDQLFALYLDRLGRVDEALQHYQHALALNPKSAELNYNVALTYIKKKDYERALYHAREAYAIGFPLPGLRNKLRALGVWTDDAADAASQEPVGPK
jgi:TPR repeat